MSNNAEAGRQRSARLVGGILTSLVARGATSVAPLLLIPIALSRVGEERYGVWMAVTAVTAVFLWADLGLGNSLLTRLSRAVTLEDWRMARSLVSTAYILLSCVAGVGVVLVVMATWFLPWESVLNASTASEPAKIAGVCLAAFVVNIPIALIHRVLYAVQRVVASNTILMCGALLSLMAAVVAVGLDLSPLGLIALVVVSPVVTNLIASLWFFKDHPRLRPGSDLSRTAASELVGTGLKFMSIAVMTSVALGVDNLIVAHVSSAAAVADFSVVSRLFAAVGMLVTVINLPLWPANADALARGDSVWVRRTTRRMGCASGLSAAVAGLLLIALSDQVLAFVGGNTQIVAARPLMIGLWVMWTLLAVAAPLFMVQNAVGVLRPQMVGWATFLMLSIIGKVYVGQRWGIAWIPVTAAGLYAVTVMPAAYVGYRRALRSSEHGPADHSLDAGISVQ